jgi:flagellar hook-associated protein 1 FlgK
VLNQPESTSMRQIATLQGQTLTRTLNEMASHTAELRAAIDGQISGMAVDINRLTAQIAQLNIRIAEVTGGGQLPSDAVGLTDQRNRALADLAELIGVQVNTQTDGSVSIYLNGSYLVDAGMARPLEVINSIDRGMTISTLQISDINTPVVPASGRLRGLISSRDEVLGEFQGRLDSLAGTLAFEFNKIYAGGQGMSAYSETTSLNAVSSPDASLSQAGLPFQPVNGSLKITTLNTLTGASMTTDIPVALLGRGHDTSLNSLAAEIDGIAGLDARVVNGKLTIAATDANTTFYFGADTSGALASLGINTFFAGSKAGDIAVNNTVLANPGKFAASSKGIGTDTTNAVTLARFLSMPLAAENGATLQSLYSSLVTDVTQSSAGATAAADAADTLQATLASQQMAVSGVNIDEEAVNLLAYQRAYQASARFISTINDLLTMLVQL